MVERHIRVQRTARYHTIGDAPSARSIWLVLHGYGQLARFFLNAFAEHADEHFVVAPEGLSRFYVDSDHQRVGATWMTREDRQHEIADHTAYLDQLASLLLSEAPKAPLCVLGFSQGVATAARWLAQGKTRPAQCVLWGGTLPPDIPQEVLQRTFQAMRLDLVHGSRDEVVTETIFRGNEERLTRAGLQVHTHTFPGGHHLDPVILSRFMDEDVSL